MRWLRWVVVVALGIVAACDLNPQPEVPAEQGAAGDNGLGGSGGGVFGSGGSGGSAGEIGTGAGGALDSEAGPPDDATFPAANEAGDADLDAADGDDGDAEPDAG